MAEAHRERVRKVGDAPELKLKNIGKFSIDGEKKMCAQKNRRYLRTTDRIVPPPEEVSFGTLAAGPVRRMATCTRVVFCTVGRTADS